MVGNIASPPEAGLREVLVARARHSSDARLVADVIGGLAALLVAVSWHPRAWFALACAAVCFIAFGGWGICDREIGELGPSATGWPAVALRLIRTAVSVAGALAAGGLLLQVLAVALGTWIS